MASSAQSSKEIKSPLPSRFSLLSRSKSYLLVASGRRAAAAAASSSSSATSSAQCVTQDPNFEKALKSIDNEHIPLDLQGKSPQKKVDSIKKREDSRLLNLEATRNSEIVVDFENFDFFDTSSYDLYTSLKSISLEHCHGILHAAGIRNFCELRFILPHELLSMEFNLEDFRNLSSLIHEMKRVYDAKESRSKRCAINKSQVSSGFGVFQDPYRPVNFQFTSQCKNNQIFTGRFLNVEQCQQILRMAESYAYKHSGWRPEIYTLTNLDLHVKAIPGMLGLVNPFMDQLMGDVHRLFPGCKPGTTNYRNDNEPHLVKYMGTFHQGVCMHTDSADITVTIALSDPNDFTGGGTYYESIDKTIVPQQGEMVIHTGPLKHLGVDITAGTRIILVSLQVTYRFTSSASS